MATPSNGQGMPTAGATVPLTLAQLQTLARTNPVAYQQFMQQQNQKNWTDFFNHRPDLRDAAHAKDPETQRRLQAEFHNWLKARPVQQVMPMAAVPSTGPAASGAASGGSVGAATGRPTRQASGVSPDALAGATAAAQTNLAARDATNRETSLKKLQAAFAFLSRPASPDEKTFLPHKRLATLFQKACGGGGKLAPEAEAGVRALAEDFSRGALSFAVAAARRRRSATLDPADVALYVKQTYGVDLPGFGRAEVAPYRRLTGSEAHKARLAAVRRANVAMTRQAGAAAGKAKDATGAGASPAKSKKGGTKATAAARKAAAAAAAAAAEEDEGMELEDALEEELGGAAGEEEDMPDI